jgi:hypothetical protein
LATRTFADRSASVLVLLLEELTAAGAGRRASRRGGANDGALLDRLLGSARRFFALPEAD